MSREQKRWPPNIRKLEPTRAWEVLSVREEARPLPLGPLQHPGPQPPGTVRFVCVSDTHSNAPKQPLPAGDCLIHAGDFTDTGRPEELEAFCAWLKAQPHARKVVIAGNHDLTLDPDSYPRTHRRFGHKQPHDCAAARAMIEGVAEYLHDSGTSVCGLRLWGSPWQPEFCGWAFNLQRGEACAAKWRLIPPTTDVLVTHGPPLGHGDLCQGGKRAGCLELLDVVTRRVRPALHVFGHIHEGYGATTNGVTTFANASTCTVNYQPDNPPLVFDLPLPAPDARLPASDGLGSAPLGCEQGGEAVSGSGGVHYCPLEEAGPTGRGPDGVTVGAESEAAALAVSEQRRCSLS